MTLRVCSLVALPVMAFGQTFEVASVKLTASPEPGFGTERIAARGGSLTMSNVRLRTAIKWAYNIKEFQIAGPNNLGAPYDYREGTRYNIAAKAPPETPVRDLRLMLRALLAERLLLKTHREPRETTSLVLTLQNGPHKLRPPSDPEGEFAATPSPSDLQLENATLDEFGDAIAGKLRMPVLNRTGLAARFNFGLDFSHFRPPVEDEYLFTRAIQEQLGLKVTREKAAIEMLVVDHVEKRPAEN